MLKQVFFCTGQPNPTLCRNGHYGPPVDKYKSTDTCGRVHTRITPAASLSACGYLRLVRAGWPSRKTRFNLKWY